MQVIIIKENVTRNKDRLKSNTLNLVSRLNKFISKAEIKTETSVKKKKVTVKLNL